MTPHTVRAGAGAIAANRLRWANPSLALLARELERTERLSREELRGYQERRLRRLVRWAATASPFYRRWFRESGIAPAEIRWLDDLSRLPLLERADLVERPEEFRALPRHLMWRSHSSGTSGQPVTVYRTGGSSIVEAAMLARQWGWFGLRSRPRALVLRGHTFAAARPGVVAMENPGSKCLLVSSFLLDGEHGAAIWAAIERFSPEAVEGWPSSITLLAALLRDMGRTLPVRAIITSSEVITGAQLRLLDEVFQAPVVDHYGQTERVTMAGACEAGSYHLFPDYAITELLPDPDHAGHYEVVGTPLHNWGFPLFRYRTGDRVAAAPSGLCPCGRAFPRLGGIDGRAEDLACTAQGRRIPLASEVVDDLAGVREVQLVQRRPGVFELRMVPGTGFEPARLAAAARRKLDEVMGPGQELSVRVMEAIPRPPSGKLRPFLVLDGERDLR